MVSNRCKIAVKTALKKFGIRFVVVDLGEIEIMEALTNEQHESLKIALLGLGLELMEDKKSILIEKINTLIIELFHLSDDLPKVNYRNYLSENIGYDYTYLSNIFSEVRGITIQQFIIIHKIELVKELLFYGELNLSEISYKLNYSSVAHLSNQFKKVTGLSPSNYKSFRRSRNQIKELGNATILAPSNS